MISTLVSCISFSYIKHISAARTPISRQDEEDVATAVVEWPFPRPRYEQGRRVRRRGRWCRFCLHKKTVTTTNNCAILCGSVLLQKAVQWRLEFRLRNRGNKGWVRLIKTGSIWNSNPIPPTTFSLSGVASGTSGQNTLTSIVFASAAGQFAGIAELGRLSTRLLRWSLGTNHDQCDLCKILLLPPQSYLVILFGLLTMVPPIIWLDKGSILLTLFLYPLVILDCPMVLK